MGFFERLSVLLKSNINDLISRAEDPQKVLDQALTDMRTQMVEAKGRVALSIADEKRLQKQHENEVKRAEEWEKKAMAAVRAGRDDLAVEALNKKRQHESAGLQFEGQLNQQRDAVEGLKKALGMLNAKIDDANRQRQLLVARAQRAKAQKAIAETLSKTNDRSAFDGFERMSDKVDQLEAEAEARMEVAALTGTSHSDSLSERIKELEAHVVVDDDLLELKKKMGLLSSGQASAQLQSGEAKAKDPESPLPQAGEG